MAQTNMPKPGKNGYKIVFATNTVVMNYKFAAAAAQYGTPESQAFSQALGLETQQLCAVGLSFSHPVTGEPMRLRSRLDV